MKTPAKKAKVAKLKAPVKAEPITDTKAAKPVAPAEPGTTQKASDLPAFGGKGDHDQNGKPGGDAKAQPKEPRPMPKDFKLTTVREGSRIVARQDGIEVPFMHTDDKDEFAKREQQQRESMWAALEARRIKALG